MLAPVVRVTRDADAVTTCALGFFAKTGKAGVAAVDTSGALLGTWDIVLMPPETERFVYHNAELMPRSKADAWVREATRAATKQTAQSVRALVKEIDADVTQAAVVGKTLELPGPLDKILASHTLLHTSEGVLYRAAIADALHKVKIEWSLVTPDALTALQPELVGFGKVAPPFRREHKDAALAALSLVRGGGRGRVPRTARAGSTRRSR